MKVIVAIAVLLSACASTPPPSFSGPNGKPAYSIRCSSERTLISLVRGDCYQQASDLCPGGYMVVDRYASFDAGTTTGQNLIVECKGP